MKEINIGYYRFQILNDGGTSSENGIFCGNHIDNIILENKLEGVELEVILRPKEKK